ncbi:MAG: tRNA (adenosine(37)-N6)-threonylcarbamoyltransferase complex ATPase subunit type 1 TsaE [Xenococcaceae cyanobacterium]
MALQSVAIFLPDAQATRQLGRVLGQSLPAGSVVLLEGDLGAGKTTLVQGIGEGLGITEPIVSPTFTLINEYIEGRLPLYHLDFYRLQAGEIEAISPETYWEGVEVPPGITAIEWAQRLPYKPPNYLDIQLTHALEQGRQANVLLVGEFNFDQEILNFEF